MTAPTLTGPPPAPARPAVTAPRRPLGAAARDLGSLWIAGAALAQIFVCHLILPLSGEAYEWAQYVLLGSVLPLAALGLILLRLRFPTAGWLAGAARLTLAAAAVGGAVAAVAHWPDGIALAAAVAQVGVVGVADRRAGGSRLVPAGVLAASWVVAARFLWWVPLETWATASAFALAVFAAAVVLVPIALRPAAGRRWWAADVAALALLAWASLRAGPFFPTPDQPLGANMYHHWGAIVSPAELVRQGGWLLWDVPAQYGFLSTLTLAALPTPSVWHSLYWLNAVLLALTAGGLFLGLRSVGRGPANFVVTLAAALAAVCLIPGNPRELFGPHATPAVGPFRFFWCFALLGVLAWEFRAEAAGRCLAAVPWVGSIVWLVGVLWSAESAVYCSCTWAPAFVLIAVRRAVDRHPGPGQLGRRIRAAAAWLTLPPGLLAVAVVGITTWYRERLRHAPDWGAFFEYSGALGFFAAPIDPGGVVWVLVLAFCVAAAAVVACARPPLPLGALALLVGSWAALWATASYFVGRSAEVNGTNLTPFILAAVTVPLIVFARRPVAGPMPALARAAVVPLVTVLLTAAYANPAGLATFVRSLADVPADLSQLLPHPPDSLLRLAAAAGVRPDDAVVYVDDKPLSDPLPPRPLAADAGTELAAPRLWLPAHPFVLYLPLPEPRRQVYLLRFIDRARLGGWLIEPKKDPLLSYEWVHHVLRHTHVAGPSFENADWTITRYDPR